MKQKSSSNIIAIVVIILLIVVGGLTYWYAQNSAPPIPPNTNNTDIAATVDVANIVITPPDTLVDIAAELEADYPELAELLNNPKLESVYKDFYITYINAGKEAALAMAHQRGLLNENGDVTLSLVLDTPDQTEALVTEIEAEGVIVESSYQDQVNIIVPMALILEQLEAEEPELIIERISSLEHVIALRLPPKFVVQAGPATGQGVEVTLANTWHDHGITGKGVKIGILDLGFAGYENLLGTELPGKVTVQTFGNTTQFNKQVHGTAVAEIVHDMAPEADLYLIYFDSTAATLGQAVDWLINQGVDIISNSTSVSGISPMDGTGFTADLVNKAKNSGILWVNATGNRGDEHYRGTFTDTDNDTLHEFAPGISAMPVTIKSGTATNIILSWNDWGAVNQDYDLILYDKHGNLLAKSENFQTGEGGQGPYEVIYYQFPSTDTYLLAIQNKNGAARGDATLDIFTFTVKLPVQYQVAEASLGTPADAHGAFSIGAVHWSSDELEPYSSQGPTTDGRIKPDLVGPSVVKSVSYAPSIFDGTSAATPHVSGAAALILQAFPNYTPDDITTLLKDKAVQLGEGTPNIQFGSGRLNLGELPE